MVQQRRNYAYTLAGAAGMSAARTIGRAAVNYAGRMATGRRKSSYSRYNRVPRLPPGLSIVPPTKKYMVNFPDQTRGSNELHYVNFTDGLSQGDAINDRLRQTIYVKSVRLSWFVQSAAVQSGNVAMLCRWAIVQPKGRRIFATSNDIGEDFFCGLQTSRYVNFSSIANAMHKHTFLINREAWTVHAEGRFSLKGYQQTYNGAGEAYRSIDKVVKVNSKLYFDTIDGPSQNGVYFVFWFNQPYYNAIAADPLTTTRSTIQTTCNFIEV